MATKKVVLKGQSMWARIFPDNRDMKGYEGAYEEFDGAYTIDLLMDKENKMKLKDSGSAKKGKFDDDGNFSVKFIRKHKDRFEWASGAPEVVKADGTAWDFETDGPINNGSDIEVELSVYTTAYSPGTRLEKVKVLKLAEDEAREPAGADEGWD